MYALQFDHIYPDWFFQFLQDSSQWFILSDLKTLFSNIYLLYFYFIYTSILPTCMYVHHVTMYVQCLWRSERA